MLKPNKQSGWAYRQCPPKPKCVCYRAKKPITVTGLSRLPPNLEALRIPLITYTTTVDTSSVTPTLNSFAISSLPYTGTAVTYPPNQPSATQTSTVDGFYAPDYSLVVLFLTGPDAGQPGIEPISYDGATMTVTLASNLPAVPQNGDVVSFQIPETWWINDCEETFLAVNPLNPKNKIIATRQDLFGEGAGVGFLANIFMYTKDGGKTWNQSQLTYSRDQGATLDGAANDYESSSNAKVAFDNQGNAYIISTAFNTIENFAEANVFAKSTDGGVSWTQPYGIESDDGLSHFLDNPYIIADPYRKNTIYVVSADDLSQIGGTTGNVFIQISRDGGEIWSAPFHYVITLQATQFEDSFTPAMAVLNDCTHTLLVIGNSFLYSQASSGIIIPGQTRSLYVSTSFDDGLTWNQRRITTYPIPNVIDPATGLSTAIESDAQVAASPSSKRVYIAYPVVDPSIYPAGQASTALIMSNDSGLTWTRPIAANPKGLNVQSFTPSVSVANDGTVAVLFYDFRFYQPGAAIVATDAWVTLWTKNLEFIQEVRLTEQSFDLHTAIQRFPFPGQYYLGDYNRITNVGDDFVASYAVTNSFYVPSYQQGLQPIPPSTTPGGSFQIDAYPREKVQYSQICKFVSDD